MALLDINNSAGESFKRALDEEFAPENSFFFKCDVESEEQIKGKGRHQSQPSSGRARSPEMRCLMVPFAPAAGGSRVLIICILYDTPYIVSSDQGALKKTMETFGGLDILCNNAGILNEEEWETTVSINMVRSCQWQD